MVGLWLHPFNSEYFGSSCMSNHSSLLLQQEKDRNCSGDNQSCDICRLFAPDAVRSAPPSYQHLRFLQAGCPPSPAGPKHWRQHIVDMICQKYTSCLTVLQDTDNLWWDSFATDFFEDDATLTLTFCLEDGLKRYSMYIIIILIMCRHVFACRAQYCYGNSVCLSACLSVCLSVRLSHSGTVSK